MEQNIKMIAAASEVLNYRKKDPTAIDEEIFQHISDFISAQGIKDQNTKRSMIAAASKAFDISRKNPNLTDKQILKQLMEEIPIILQNLEETDF
ncbi:MAG: hypothetical protein ACP5OG_00085 [Candidatus Nanoarchaeia archaeon]